MVSGMAEENHITWLLEGVKAWNARRQREDLGPGHIVPNFSYMNLWWEFLDAGNSDEEWPISLAGANLVEADLSHTMLRRVNFDNADLIAAYLTYANLSDTLLTNADLRDADLTDANLRRSNLTGADLRDAVLINADLTNVDLTAADITTTDITGANLSGTETWNAILYRDSKSPEQYEGKLMPVKTIGDLLHEIQKLKEHHQNHEEEILFYFRGESKCGWKLQPSVTRDGFLRSESKMLLDFISRRPEEFSRITSALAQWVLARHHGLRTRFLDITKNPLVAIFNACAEKKEEEGLLHVFAVPRSLVKPFNSDTISVIANFAKLSRDDQNLLLGKKDKRLDEYAYRLPDYYKAAMKRLYQFIQEEKPYFENRIDPKDLFRVSVVEPQQLSERVKAQAGCFLVSAFHERFEREKILEWNNDIPIYAYYCLSIPKECKTNIVDNLQLLNITRETLFPGLDESAAAITKFYCQ